MIIALPAEMVRQVPDVPMRLTLIGAAESGGERVIGEYVFDHHRERRVSRSGR
jgi:hypothetical protein